MKECLHIQIIGKSWKLIIFIKCKIKTDAKIRYFCVEKRILMFYIRHSAYAQNSEMQYFIKQLVGLCAEIILRQTDGHNFFTSIHIKISIQLMTSSFKFHIPET